MAPLVQARISYAIKLVGVLVAVGGVVGAAWVALNATGIFTPITIALFILLALVALITALQEFVKADPLTEIIPGDAGVQAQATVTATLDEVHQLLLEIKGVVTSLPQPQASVSITTPASATGTESTTITATAGDVAVPVPPPTPVPLPNWTGPSPEPVPLPNWIGPSPEPTPVDAPGLIAGDMAGATINDTSVLIAVPQPAPDAAGDASAVADAVPETLYRQKTDPAGHVYFVPVF